MTPSKFKVWSDQDKEGDAAIEEHSEKKGYEFIAFDGRKDKVVEKNSKKSLVENITIVDAVTGNYMDHQQPPNGN